MKYQYFYLLCHTLFETENQPKRPLPEASASFFCFSSSCFLSISSKENSFWTPPAEIFRIFPGIYRSLKTTLSICKLPSLTMLDIPFSRNPLKSASSSWLSLVSFLLQLDKIEPTFNLLEHGHHHVALGIMQATR